MNHTSDQHPWFLRVAGVARRPVRRLVPVARPGRLRRRRRAAPAQQLGVVLRRPGLEVGAAARQFYQHTFLAEQPELDWRDPAVEAAQFAMVRGWLDARRRRLPARRLQRLPQAPRPALQPDPARAATAVGPPGPRLRQRPARLAGAARRASGPSSTSGPDGCRSASCSTARSSARPASPRDRHLVFDWELLTQPWSAAGSGRAIARPRGGLRAGRWPTVVLSNHDQPRARLAPRRRRSRDADRDAIARAAAVLPADAARDAVPVLRRGARAGRRARSRRTRVVDPAGPRTSGRTSRGGTASQLPDADAVDGGSRAPGSRRAGRGSGSGRTTRRGTSPTQAADPDSVLACTGGCSRSGAADAVAPGRRHRARPRRPPDVLAYRRGRRARRRWSCVNFGRADATVTVARPAGAGAVAAASSTPTSTPAARRLADGVALDARGRSRRSILAAGSRRRGSAPRCPCYHGGRSQLVRPGSPTCRSNS